MKSTIVGNTSRPIAIEHETVWSALVFPMTCPVSEPRWQQCEVWVERVIRVIGYCPCKACDSSVVELCEVRCGMVNDFGCSVCYF